MTKAEVDRDANPITVIAPGSPVTLADDVPAVITGVAIWQGGHVVYNVAWWDGRERKTDTVEPCEVKPREECSSRRIGFQ